MQRVARLVVVVSAVTALVISGCGDSGESSSEVTVAPGTSANVATTLQPRVGGTLVFAQFSEPTGLDPTVPSGTGATGSTW